MRFSALLGSLLFFFLMGCASSASNPASPSTSTPPALTDTIGSYAVQDVDLVLRDPSRSKDLSVKVSYPTGEGVFPVIVFSHGAGGAGRHYFPLTHFWATHGYVVLHPTHDDSGALAGAPTRQGLRAELEEVISDPKAWENRARDVSFVMDSLNRVEERVPALVGKLDRNRLGVGGHSYGAYTAQLIAGATVDLPGGEKGKSFADPRPDAILLLSAQGSGQQGLTERSWEKVTRPMMVMTGSADRSFRGREPEWRLEPYQFAPSGDKYTVYLEGAGHLSFTGRLAEPDGGERPGRRRGMRGRARGAGMSSPEEERAIFRNVKVASLSFWNAYLKGDERAKALLKTGALERESGGKLRVTSK